MLTEFVMALIICLMQEAAGGGEEGDEESEEGEECDREAVSDHLSEYQLYVHALV
jgi:hypothetical protein